MISVFKRLYSRFLFWKLDREYRAAECRMRDCQHTNTMLVDVGSPPYDCVEKCCDCWALRLPVLGQERLRGKREWTPNCASPKRATPAHIR